MSFDPFAPFDVPLVLKRHATVKSTRNQTTGAYVPATETVTSITGSIDKLPSWGDDGVAGEYHDERGLYMGGGVRLFTESDIAIEDRIEVQFAGALGSRFFRVTGIPRDYTWIESLVDGTAPQRREYYLSPEEPAR